MKKAHFLSILFIIIAYSIASFLINRSYILPNIFEIIDSLTRIVFSKDFISVIFTTIYRSVLGLLISFVLALLIALMSYYSEKIRDFFEPIYTLLKTIPNITYIIVSLLWFGRNGSVIIVSMLVVFPILYKSFLNGLLNIDSSLIKATRLYDISFLDKTRKIYLPLIEKDIILALSNACSLGFKVSIMAEILSQVKSGIGKELYYAKINFLMSDIFAWTIIIILISYLFDLIIKSLLKKDES